MHTRLSDRQEQGRYEKGEKGPWKRATEGHWPPGRGAVVNLSPSPPRPNSKALKAHTTTARAAEPPHRHRLLRNCPTFYFRPGPESFPPLRVNLADVETNWGSPNRLGTRLLRPDEECRVCFPDQRACVRTRVSFNMVENQRQERWHGPEL